MACKGQDQTDRVGETSLNIHVGVINLIKVRKYINTCNRRVILTIVVLQAGGDTGRFVWGCSP